MMHMMDSPTVAVGLLMALILIVVGLLLALRIHANRQVSGDHDARDATRSSADSSSDLT